MPSVLQLGYCICMYCVVCLNIFEDRNIDFLGIIRCPVFAEDSVSESGLFLHPQVNGLEAEPRL
jgi:hypothetical protein